MANDVKLNCEMNKNYFHASDNDQIAYLLLEAKPSNGQMNEKTPLNLCLVMDRSASMKGSKIENVKKAICNIVDRMNSEDYLSLVIFNEEAEVLVASQSVKNPNDLKDKIKQLTHSGGTAISAGMKTGLAEIQKHLSGDKINRMIVLTDGQTYGDEEACYLLSSEAAKDGITVTALGVGDEWHEEVLDTIADKNNGKSDYIATPEDIIPIFDSEMTTMENIVTQNNVLTLRFTDGVQPRKVCRVIPYISELDYESFTGNDVVINIGDLDQNQGQNFLIELLLPPSQQGKYRVSQAELIYDIPNQNIFQRKVREDVIAEFSNDEALCKKINPKVMNVAEKVSAYDIQTRAINQATAGDISSATQKLKVAATRLLDMGEKDLAQAAIHEIDLLENQGAMSSAGTKKLRYETRRLTQRLPV